MLTTSTTAVVLDSTADLPDARERFANFRIVPLLVRFPGSEELRDYIDLQPPEFYERLAAAPSPPRTSQPSPEQFASTYAELLAEGYEHIVSLHISGKLSGTLGSARLAAAEWPSQVTVLDTQLASVGIAMCALRVQGMLAEGTTIEAVTAYVEGFAARVRLVFSVDTLEYLVRGGRIGKAQGMVGSLLSVKPILECKDGEVHGVGRARGRSRVVPALEAELVQGSPADAPLRVGLAHSAAPQLLEAVAQMVARVRPAATVELATTLGAVIGTYTGPGTIGLMWLQGTRPDPRSGVALKDFLRRIARRKRLMIGLQIAALVTILLIFGLAVQEAWSEALPLIREADVSDLVWAHVWLMAYYLAFVVGWIWILRSLDIRLSYPVALQAEMVSMLAKYIPGGVWTAAARVVAVRRTGVKDNSQILGSIALEAGLSAVAGVLVFVVSLTIVESVDAPTWPLVGFALLLCTLLHPRIFTRLGTFLFKPFGGSPVRALPLRTALGLLGYYSFTWLLGGMSLYFMVRSVGDASLSEVPYLGGAACVGAIVAVLFVFAPSGLGVREGAMYGLLLAIEPRGVALATVAINRIAITVVEAILLLGAAAWRLYLRRRRAQVPEP